MGCGCKNKGKQNVQLEIADSSPILLDESLISQLGKSTLSNKKDYPFCKLSSNEYNSNNVSIKIHNKDGSLLHEVSVSKYESLEHFIKIILNFEKSSNIHFSNKDCIASEIASHTYVHKVVKQCIDDYGLRKISLKMFQDRIEKTSHLSYDNSQELVAEFEKAKKLLH
jgi:hypothetical protein